jgi:hypothetical protein
LSSPLITGQLHVIGSLSVVVKYIQLATPSDKSPDHGYGRLEIAVKSFNFLRGFPRNADGKDNLEDTAAKGLFNPAVVCKTFDFPGAGKREKDGTWKPTIHEGIPGTPVAKWKEKDIPCGVVDNKMRWKEQGSSGFSHYDKKYYWDERKVPKKISKGDRGMPIPVQLLYTNSVAASNEMISLQAVRLICISIFQRCIYPMTSRQAIAYADSCFSRSRIAPCITDAFVVEGKAKDLPSLSKIFKGPQKDKAGKYTMNVFKYTDVLKYVNMKWDKELNENAGSIDLWFWNKNEKGEEGVLVDGKMQPNPSLKELIGYDPYQIAMRTPADLTLILRGRRAGDGDWFEYKLEFSSSYFGVGKHSLSKVIYGGDETRDFEFPSKKPEKGTPLVPLDVADDHVGQHLKWLSKEEFMSGMVGSPVLAESLRRMTSADTEAKPAKEASLTLKVDMGMGDESFSGFVSVGKKVLFEVWDAKGITSEFLGEVYINDLEECREMYEGSFPLQAGTLESILGYSRIQLHSKFVSKSDDQVRKEMPSSYDF